MEFLQIKNNSQVKVSCVRVHNDLSDQQKHLSVEDVVRKHYIHILLSEQYV